MKKVLITLSIAALLFAGCSNNQSKEHDHNDGTHQHDDGAEHQNNEADDSVKQEEFTAAPDTTSQNHESKHRHSHDGENGHEHPHKH